MSELPTPRPWVSGLQLRDREACALVDGQWLMVVSTDPQPCEVNVNSLHPYTALRFNDGFVLPYAPAATPQSALAICASLDQSMHELFLYRALKDRTDATMLEAALHHGSENLPLLRLALRQCALHTDSVLVKVLTGMANADPTVSDWDHSTLTELISHANEPAVLLAAIQMERPSMVIAASIRIAELGCEAAIREQLLHIAYNHAFFTGPPMQWPRRGHWVKASLCALTESDAVELLRVMLAQSDSVPSVTANISEAFETLLVSKPHSTASRRARILIRTLKAHASHAVVLNTKTIYIPHHLPLADRKAVQDICRDVGITVTEQRSNYPEPHEATNAWEAAAIANGYDYDRVRALQLPLARARLIETGTAIDTKLLIEATTDASEAVRIASLVRLADPAAWRTALQSADISLAELAKKAPREVLTELWAQGHFVNEPAVVLVMLRRCALTDTEASFHPQAAVRLAAAFASPNEELLAALINDTDDQVALQASFRTARVEHWAAGIARISTAAVSLDVDWNRCISIELPAREMDLRRGELARTSATSEPLIARAAIQAICDEPVLWSLQQNPALAEWATARLVTLTDASS